MINETLTDDTIRYYNLVSDREKINDGTISVKLEGDNLAFEYSWVTPEGARGRIFSFYDNLISMASIIARDLASV